MKGSDFHARFFQQPHLKLVTLEDVSESLRPVTNIRGVVSYEGFLRAVLSRDDMLRESILRRGCHSSVASDDQVSPVPVDEGSRLAHVIEVSKELNFYRASLNGFCVSSHMVDSFFTEHVAVMSPLWLDVLWHHSEYMQGEHVRLWPGTAFWMCNVLPRILRWRRHGGLDFRTHCQCGAHVLCGGIKSFTMTCSIAASESMAVFHHDVAKDSFEEVHTVIGMLS